MLIAQGFGARMELAPGYLAVLRQATGKPHDGPKGRSDQERSKRAALI
jgi:hypothetical protein